jgi:hypothetical protein
MRKFLMGVLALFAVSAFAATSAMADSPHFIGTPSATVSGNSLVITFKAAGLGTGDYADFSLTGTVNVSSRCYTKSNNKPQAANKQESINVDQNGSFPVRGGQTTGSFTVTPLSTLSCPPGQRVVIESISYNLTLKGPAGITATFVAP